VPLFHEFTIRQLDVVIEVVQTHWVVFILPLLHDLPVDGVPLLHVHVRPHSFTAYAGLTDNIRINKIFLMIFPCVKKPPEMAVGELRKS
jgi:hypothetical protein